METIPNFWAYKTPIEAKKEVLLFKPYSGPTQTRSFGSGAPQHHWKLGDPDINHEDFLEIKEFWDTHFPGVQFYLWDPQLDESRVYEIVSNFANHYNTEDSYSWSFRISECYPYTVTEGPPPP